MSMFSLRSLCLMMVILLVTTEFTGLLLWFFCPKWMHPWFVDVEIVTDYTRDSKKVHNITIQVNPVTQLFSGNIPRMVNSYIIYDTDEYFNKHWTPMSSSNTPNTDYDDSVALENTHHFREQLGLTASQPVPVGLTKRSAKAIEDNSWKKKAERLYNEKTARMQAAEPNLAECLMLSTAICCNLILLAGVLHKRPLLFLPWMCYYGLELFAGWIVSLAFILLPDWFRLAASLGIIRSSLLTWFWICVVRRHQKKINSEMSQRPRLLTLISMVTAHPFTPRPDMDLYQRPKVFDFDL